MSDRTPYCLHCGKVTPKVLEQTWAEWEAMVFCDEACEKAYSARRRSRDAHLIQEVEALLGTDSAASIARRLHYVRPESLAKQLQRIGRPDLALHFQRSNREALVS